MMVTDERIIVADVLSHVREFRRRIHRKAEQGCRRVCSELRAKQVWTPVWKGADFRAWLPVPPTVT